MRLIILLSFLVGCAGIPIMPDTEVCELQINLTNHISCCICHIEHFNRDYVGKVKNTITVIKELAYCDKMVGFRTVKDPKGNSPWGNVSIFIQEMFAWLRVHNL
jgi:hypothetical protein